MRFCASHPPITRCTFHERVSDIPDSVPCSFVVVDAISEFAPQERLQTAKMAPVEDSHRSNTSTNSTFEAEPRIEVREYVPEDHPHVVKLFVDGMMLYTEASHPHYQVWLDYVANSLATDLADIPGTYLGEGCNFFIVEAVSRSSSSADDSNNKVIVGTIGVQKRSTSVAELRRVSVKSEYRRYGIGRLLMAHATQWAKDQGFEKLILSTAATQHLAKTFYETLGYRFSKTSVMVEDPYFELTHFEKEI